MVFRLRDGFLGLWGFKSRQAKIGWKSLSQNQLPSSNQELTGQQWESFLRQIKDELVSNTYRPMGLRKKEILSRNQVWRPQYTPRLKKRKALFVKLREIFRRFMSQPVERVIELINPILRGWVNYFAVWHSSRCFAFVKDWVEKKIRRHLMRSRKRPGFGWKRWSKTWFYEGLGLYNGYRLHRLAPLPKASPAGAVS